MPCEGAAAISPSSPNQEPLKGPVTGDFDDGANALWTLYGKEAESHDIARVQSVKEDMDGVLIYVRSSSSSYFHL